MQWNMLRLRSKSNVTDVKEERVTLKERVIITFQDGEKPYISM